MRGRKFLFSMTMTLLTFVLLGGYCYGQNYVPIANEECYGTWINEKTINQGHIQKKISSPEGNKDFLEATDTVPIFADEQQIYAKWTDSEGNIWYKTFGTVIAGAYKGTKWQELDKLTKSATVWEYVFAIVGEFDSKSYPTRVDPKEANYRIFYRAEEKYVPKPDEELYGTWTNEQNFGDNFHPRKVVVTADGYTGYFNIADSVPLFTWNFSIDKKWTDSDGNIWYKILGTEVGTYEGIKSQELYKLSKSGTVMERAWVDLGHGEFDPSKYPTEIDLKSYYYRILYRTE